MPLDEPATRAAAEGVARSLAERDFSAVFDRFHRKLAAAYPLAKFRTDVEQEAARAGSFTGEVETQAAEVGDFARARVACSCERGVLLVQVAFDARGYIVELLARADVGSDVSTDRRPSGAWGTAALCLTLLALPVAAAMLLTRAERVDIEPAAFIIGTMAWGLAASLRIPIVVVMSARAEASRGARKRWMPERHQTAAVLSGIAQEGARVAALATIGRTFEAAVSIGLGWAAVEAVFVVATAIGVARAREPADGPLRTLVTRLGMTAFHIGATLLVARAAAWVLLTVALHIQPMLVKGARLRAANIALTGAGLLAAGLAVFERAG